MFKCIFLNKNVWIPIDISLKFVPNGSINNNPVLFQLMAWRRPGDKPFSEPMMVSSLTHICLTRPQWVKGQQADMITVMSHEGHGISNNQQLSFIQQIVLTLNTMPKLSINGPLSGEFICNGQIPLKKPLEIVNKLWVVWCDYIIKVIAINLVYTSLILYIETWMSSPSNRNVKLFSGGHNTQAIDHDGLRTLTEQKPHDF